MSCTNCKSKEPKIIRIQIPGKSTIYRCSDCMAFIEPERFVLDCRHDFEFINIVKSNRQLAMCKKCPIIEIIKNE